MVSFVDALVYSAKHTGRFIPQGVVRTLYGRINTWNEEIYLHFKGGIYQYLYTARDSMDKERKIVVYRHLFPHEEEHWIRPYDEFFSAVPKERALFPDQMRFEKIEKGAPSSEGKLLLKSLENI